MNLSGFLSRNTRKAHRQISKALLDNKKIEFNDKFNETITESNIATDSQILDKLKKMVNDSISITKNLLKNKKENVLKAILGPKGAAAQLSNSIYTSGSSNFKKIFAPFTKINYDNNNDFRLNNKTIENTKIDTLLRNLKRYLKMNDDAIETIPETTDDDGISDINIKSIQYKDVNKKFNEGGLIAKLKILICLLLLYYLTEEEAKKNDKSNPKPSSSSPSNPSPSPQSSNSSSSSSSSINVIPPKKLMGSPQIASHNFKFNSTPSSNSSSSSSSINVIPPKKPTGSPQIASHNFKPGPPPPPSSSTSSSSNPSSQSNSNSSSSSNPSSQSSSSSSSSSSSPTQQSSSSSSSSAPHDLPEPKVVHPGIINPKIAPKGMVCYSNYEYKAAETKGDNENCKQHLVNNVKNGIERLGNTGAKIKKLNAKDFFKDYYKSHQPNLLDKTDNLDPRRTNNYPSSAEVNFVYDVPEKYCHVEDYSGQEPICVTDTSKSTPATLWFYRGFSLPAIFAVNNALKDEGKGELNPNSTAVQSAGNATSPGGDALMGSGTQEESLQFDSEAYLFLNTKRAYEEYYLKNKQAMAEQLEASKRMGLPCSVDAWNKTGIFSRGVYSSGVGLRNNGLCDSNGATINIITTAAADYNKEHHGTYMGPKEDSDGTLTSYQKQLITYWDTILRIAYTNGNRNIVLTTGGGGAYKGDNAEIISALFTVLTQHGPRGGICWARCFDNIIFASGSGHVETNLCKHYENIFGKSYLRRI